MVRLLQYVQSWRTSRWATMQTIAEALRKGSMFISVRRVMADGASFVWSVESTRWPVSADSIAILAVSPSRISPTMITSGSARSIERRPLGEGEAGLQVHLELVDARELVLDRVLDRDDVALRLVDLVESRVERRGLARARRARDEHRAVGAAERRPRRARAASSPMPSASRLISACDLSRIRMTIPSPSHARHRHDAGVDRVALDGQRTRPSCGSAPLGDVEVGHDLHARDDARDHPARDLRGLAQHAVDAEAHAHLAALGLEVDVRGALLDGLGDDRVDELDDRRVVGGLADLR